MDQKSIKSDQSSLFLSSAVVTTANDRAHMSDKATVTVRCSLLMLQYTKPGLCSDNITLEGLVVGTFPLPGDRFSHCSTHYNHNDDDWGLYLEDMRLWTICMFCIWPAWCVWTCNSQAKLWWPYWTFLWVDNATISISPSSLDDAIQNKCFTQ